MSLENMNRGFLGKLTWHFLYEKRQNLSCCVAIILIEYSETVGILGQLLSDNKFCPFDLILVDLVPMEKQPAV